MPKLIPKFNATVKDGQLEYSRSEMVRTYLMKFEGKEIVVTFKKATKGRSTRQNSYYWVICTHIGNEIGEEPENVHQTLKAMFLVDRSKKFPVVRSTTSLSTVEFMEYMEKIARKMDEFNIKLPQPDEAEL